MKTAKKLFIVFTSIVILTSCSNSETYRKNIDELMSTDTIVKLKSQSITVPFEVDFIGNYTMVASDSAMCGAFPEVHVIVDGKGNGTYVGNSIIHFDFCCNNETGEYGYGKTYAYIVAANGDTLFITCSGRVIGGRADDHPEYVTSYWRDPFEILGGTGRFIGASGSGTSNDYNSSEDPNSHHNWSGTITLLKAKKRKN